jgi:hypothetical protein
MKQQGLNKREKRLIFIAGALVFIYAVMQFAIFPLYAAYDDAAIERDVLQAEKDDIDFALALEGITRSSNASARGAYESASGRFPVYMPNEDVSMLITELCRVNRVTIITLSIPDSPPRDTASPELVTVDVTLDLECRYADLVSLIDATRDTEYLRATQLRFANSTYNYNAGELSGVSLTLQVTLFTGGD